MEKPRAASPRLELLCWWVTTACAPKLAEWRVQAGPQGWTPPYSLEVLGERGSFPSGRRGGTGTGMRPVNTFCCEPAAPALDFSNHRMDGRRPPPRPQRPSQGVSGRDRASALREIGPRPAGRDGQTPSWAEPGASRSRSRRGRRPARRRASPDPRRPGAREAWRSRGLEACGWV